MPTHSPNFNHFTGKTKGGDPRKNRKKKILIKTEKTEITHTNEAISVSAPKINLVCCIVNLN